MEKIRTTTSHYPDAHALDRLSELHKAMGDPTRMKILWALMSEMRCVGDLANEMHITESAVSHHLRALKMARLVSSHKSGKYVFYTLKDEHIRGILEETYAHISEG